MRLVFASVLASMLVLPGCTRETVSHEAAPTAPDAFSVERLASSSGGATDLVMFFEPWDGEEDSPLDVLRELGLEDLLVEIVGRVAHLDGVPAELTALLSDARILAVQPNNGVVLSAPSDLTMAFFEGDVTPTDVLLRPEFAALRLDRVHGAARGEGLRIAVLDTGADTQHPLLQSRLELLGVESLGDVHEVADGIDEDGDGLIDEAFGHGSHVAGIIATVAPGATIVPLPVLSDDGVGTAYQLAVALQAAIAAEVDVINLSLSIHEDSGVVRALLDRARANGIAIVAAAGNTGDQVTLPAAYEASTGTGATIVDMTRLAEFSARGIDLEFAAPGTEVLSCYPGGEWALASGSSMAAAVLSGAVAVIASSGPSITVQDAEIRLAEAAVPIDPEGSVLFGRVDLVGALGDLGTRPTKFRLHQD